MQLYELTYILKSTATVKEEQAKLVALISSFGGKVVKEEPAEKKKFAYKINKDVEGIYATILFNLPKKEYANFVKKLKLQENIIRSLITVAKKSKPKVKR
ncbi:MAG: 30S ribosomal protein S6 [Patescibacteria group bacterium]